MERWQGLVVGSFGTDQGRGAGGASGGICLYEYESGASSIPRIGSDGRRVFIETIAVSKCNRETTDFDNDYEAFRTAVVRGISTRQRKLPKTFCW